MSFLYKLCDYECMMLFVMVFCSRPTTRFDCRDWNSKLVYTVPSVQIICFGIPLICNVFFRWTRRWFKMGKTTGGALLSVGCYDFNRRLIYDHRSGVSEEICLLVVLLCWHPLSLFLRVDTNLAILSSNTIILIHHLSVRVHSSKHVYVFQRHIASSFPYENENLSHNKQQLYSFWIASHDLVQTRINTKMHSFFPEVHICGISRVWTSTSIFSVGEGEWKKNL